jgi:hypothetical protein
MLWTKVAFRKIMPERKRPAPTLPMLKSQRAAHSPQNRHLSKSVTACKIEFDMNRVRIVTARHFNTCFSQLL